MTLLSAIILLGILIFVHELGHFIFAKLAGVRVLKFSLGFGPKLVGRKFGDTEYLISAFPLGGYVKMLGENPGEELKEEEKQFAYNYQPIWKRFLIVFLGPVFNLFFAALVFVLIFLSGIPVPYPDVGEVEKNSPAAKAGLVTGDRIIAIDGSGVGSWDEIDDFMINNPGKTLVFKVKRDNKIVELSVTPVRKSEKNIFGEEAQNWNIGISPLLYPDIGEVVKGSPAAKAGLLKGDRIVEAEGKPVKLWQDLTAIIHKNPERPLRFKVKRGEREIALKITPQKEISITPTGEKKEIGLIGIRPKGNNLIKKFGVIDALFLGVKRTWELVAFTVVVIIKLIQRIVPTATLGGPIMIVQMAGEQASLGIANFFTFMALMSINLGVLNLLPIPVLDGGHLMLLTIEAIRRKPLSERVMMIVQRVGLTFLITLIVFVLYNDFMRIVVPWIKKIILHS